MWTRIPSQIANSHLHLQPRLLLPATPFGKPNSKPKAHYKRTRGQGTPFRSGGAIRIIVDIENQDTDWLADTHPVELAWLRHPQKRAAKRKETLLLSTESRGDL